MYLTRVYGCDLLLAFQKFHIMLGSVTRLQWHCDIVTHLFPMFCVDLQVSYWTTAKFGLSKNVSYFNWRCSYIFLFLQEIVELIWLWILVTQMGGCQTVCRCRAFLLGSRMCFWRESFDNPHLLCFGLHSRAGEHFRWNQTGRRGLGVPLMRCSHRHTISHWDQTKDSLK